MLSDEYVAGFFDGEGCVGRYGDHLYLRVQTVNANAAVLNGMKERFGGGVYPRPTKNPRWVQTWVHSITGRAAYDMLAVLRPHLIVKAVRVDEIFHDLGGPPAESRKGSRFCKRVHEFTPENTHYRPSARGRICRVCDRERLRRNRASAKARRDASR